MTLHQLRKARLVKLGPELLQKVLVVAIACLLLGWLIRAMPGLTALQASMSGSRS